MLAALRGAKVIIKVSVRGAKVSVEVSVIVSVRRGAIPRVGVK